MVSRRRRAARERRAAGCVELPSAVCAASTGFPSPAREETSVRFPSPTRGGGSGWGLCAPTSDRGSVLLTLIAHQHLIAQLTPNRLIDLGKPLLEPDLRDVAWARQINRVGALDGSGTGGQKDYPIGEGDRLLEVVGDEHHRC